MVQITGYEVLAPLGSGQYGDVLLIRRALDRRLFAAKVPRRGDVSAREASLQEAQLLAGLHHVNIVQLVETVEADDQFAMVLEYASGGDLHDFLCSRRENSSGNRHLSETATMRIFIQMALALQYLHDRRVLHRDLKPKNVLLDGDGIVKLSDFGVSKVLQNSLDAAHTAIGTPHYMAPEVLEGSAYAAKSDIWSLGCVLYELASYRPPFTGEAVGAVVYQILCNEPAPVPEHYSAPFQALLASLLAKDPEKRPSLSAILNSEAVQQHMRQLVSVATTHQPMLLEQFVTNGGAQFSLKCRKQQSESQKPARTLASFLGHPVSPALDNFAEPLNAVTPVKGEVMVQRATPKQDQQQVGDDARRLFFENQAAARRNKERVDQEQAGTPIFLDTAEVVASSAEPRDQQRSPSPLRAAELGVQQALHGLDAPDTSEAAPAFPPAPPASAARATASSAAYEEMLEAERRRVRLETKALHERMRALQATAPNSK